MEWGLVNRVVPRADLESTVEETAATIARMPLTTILTVKAGVKRAWEQMGMRVHLQGTADFTTIASMATDVRAFMAQRGGRLPREVAADQTGADDGAARGPATRRPDRRSARRRRGGGVVHERAAHEAPSAV